MMAAAVRLYAIRHYFPNREAIGDGLIRAGNTYPQAVKRYYSRAEAEAAVAEMAAANPGHSFVVVPHPDREEVAR